MQTFDTPAPISAVLDIAAGRVRFVAGDRADTTVEVRPADPGKGRDVKAAERTTVAYADGVLRVRTAEPGNQLFGPSGALEVTVELPAGSRVEARTASCELRTTGPLGDVAFEGAYRQITVDEAASLRLTAVDGDVEVGQLHGPAEITTARGGIRVAAAERGTVVLATQSGDITVGAAPGTSASLEATTAHGQVHHNLRNDGTPTLHLRATTAHGDITARTL